MKVYINDKLIHVEEGTTILEAAKLLDIKIPTLCHMHLHDIKFINKQASCRVCVVDVEGNDQLLPACATPCKEGMRISTDSYRAIQARRTIVELLLSDHPNSCLTCAMNLDCELQQLAHDLGIRRIHYEGETHNEPIDNNSYSIIRDPNKCILCKRCETMCTEIQTVGALTDIGRGFFTTVGSAFNRPMVETTCTFCGQCVAVCPTGALTEVNNIKRVWQAISQDKYVIVQTAPAVRVALGEEFGLAPGTPITGKMVTALKRLGFKKVFDTDFAADLTIMEEATEFVNRVKHGGKLPILTSCCPSWVNFIEQQFPDMLDIPSTCKSPHEMFGALSKSYLCEKMGLKPEDIVVVSIMPCVAKKYESRRDELEGVPGHRDVDYVITTRELAIMIKETGINFLDLPDSEFDNPMGESTGAGVIFGASGGVIEATLRTAYHMITGDELADTQMEFQSLRGLDGIKTASIDIQGRLFNIAVAHGLGNARKLLEGIRSGEIDVQAIEIMACPGGCIGGAGQPYHHGNMEILEKRMAGIYSEDRSKEKRRSHHNEYVQKLYKEYLGTPGSKKAHDLLHTYYTPRPRR